MRRISFSAKVTSRVLKHYSRSGSVTKRANHLGVTPSSLKLPVISSIAFSTARSKDWDDVVTISEGEALGRSWSVEGKRAGKWTLSGEGAMQVCHQASG